MVISKNVEIKIMRQNFVILTITKINKDTVYPVLDYK
jgi:hypothetical protein